MNLDIPELDSINIKLEKLLAGTVQADQAWYNLRQACELKGGCAYETVRQQRWLQPMGGRVDGYVGGVGVYSRETIAEWLSVTDDRQAEYHARHKTGARVPAPRKATA